MTTGTEAETKQFMSVCVQTLRQCLSDDLVTPVFVVERLCSIIHPEEKDDVEFLLSLDKDPQQEDFLQGMSFKFFFFFLTLFLTFFQIFSLFHFFFYFFY